MTKKAAYPAVDPKYCKKCNICINICPMKVLETGDEGLPHTIHPDQCTACGLCVIHCPDFAIEIIAAPDTGPGVEGNTEMHLE